MHLAALVVAATLAAPVAPASSAPPRPVVFVHGSAGSAAQFQTQAKRFAANGYPIASVEAHEYDSPNIATILPQVYAGLDARIDRLLSSSGAGQVDLVGHSLGTFVLQGYLTSTPARAARVAHYVNLDGRPAAAPPGGVPTLAIWGEGDPARTITGATNVSFPDQSHTQTVSSAPSFREMYRFFRGTPPHTTGIALAKTATVSGRAVIFPSNAGVPGGRLDVYPVGALTGYRPSGRPQHSVTLGADGSFGPLKINPGSRYEFALVRDGIATHHFYFAPFRRSDTFVRLLAGRPGEGVGELIETSDRHTALTFSRQKEWWGGEGDHLWVNGRDILNAATAPRAKRVIGVFAFDEGSDRVTDLTAPLPALFAQPFLTGMDVFIPARPGLVTIAVGSRGGGLEWATVPSWRSSEHRVTVNVDDHR